jgi:putative ABC transport system permease protein
MVAFTLPEAQRVMLNAPGEFSTVDVKAAPGVSDDTLRDRVAAAVGEGYTVKTGQQLTDESTDTFRTALSFFNNILIGFAAVALFVAVFLVLNTFSIIVAQRTAELALMRALGARRRQVIGSVLTESVVIGLVSAVLGLGLGVGVGALLAHLFGSYVGGLTLAGIGVPAAAVVSAFVVGVGVTMVAALLPAFRAARIAPVAAMRESQTQDRPLTRLAVSGGALLAVGAALLALGLSGTAGGNTLLTILGGILLAFIGVALLTPLIARPVAGLIGRLFAWSVPGKLGRLNSGRNPRRTAITAAALMIGIALVTGIYTIEESAKKAVTKAVDTQAQLDLLVYDPSNQGATFDPSIVEQIAALPGVAASSAAYEDEAVVNGEHTFVVAVSDAAAAVSMFSLTPQAGRIDSVNDGQVIVDAQTAADDNLHLGDPVTVQLVKGDPLRLTLSGIYAKSDVVDGYLIPPSATANFHTNAPDLDFIRVRDGVSVDTVKSQIDAILANTPQATVVDRQEYLDANFAQVNQVLQMIQILLALAMIIAVLGVVNTLALSVLERTRELGLLRAVGLGKWQTVRMVTVEAVVISLFGAVLGLGVGVGLGAAVVRALRDQGITEFALPWSQMITYLVLAGLVGVVAAVAPAIRAASVNVLRAIAYE